jgi:hypothetical protein
MCKASPQIALATRTATLGSSGELLTITRKEDANEGLHKNPEALSRLIPDQYRVTQHDGTETPLENEY